MSQPLAGRLHHLLLHRRHGTGMTHACPAIAKHAESQTAGKSIRPSPYECEPKYCDNLSGGETQAMPSSPIVVARPSSQEGSVASLVGGLRMNKTYHERRQAHCMNCPLWPPRLPTAIFNREDAGDRKRSGTMCSSTRSHGGGVRLLLHHMAKPEIESVNQQYWLWPSARPPRGRMHTLDRES